MMKTARVALVALCMLLLALPILAMPFFPSGNTDAQGQYLADAPELTDGDGRLNPEFDSDFEAWLCDHFAFRTAFLRVNALLNYRLFHTSVSDQVVAGKGDWLYYADTVPDYTGEGRLTEDELNGMVENLGVLAKSLARHGARLYVAAIPNKSTVYPQFMPDRYAMRDDDGNIERLRRACEALDATWIDLTQPLIEAAQGGQDVYYRTDTHWNALGAAIAAGTILRELGRSRVDYTVGDEADFTGGDLARLMGAAGALNESTPRLLPDSPLPEGNYADRRIQADGPGEGTLLVYRDSFGTAIGPWLAQAYGHTEFRWEAPLDGTRPCDDALLLICERNLREYLSEPPFTVEIGEGPSDASDGGDAMEDGSASTETDEDDYSYTNRGVPDIADFVDMDEDDDFFGDDGFFEDDDEPDATRGAKHGI